MNGEINIEVVEDPAAECARQLSAAVKSGGHVILTGGSSPKLAYELAAANHAADWAGAKLWFTDDRCVPTDSDLYNYKLVKTSLLDPLAAAGVQIDFCRRIVGENGPDAGADEYEQALKDAFDGGEPEFELALIGIGPDGHICSMFPNQSSLDEQERLVAPVAMSALEPFVPRVTLTFPALAHVKRALVLATGEGKADAICAAFAEDAPHTHEIPASMLVDHIADVQVLLDEEAASRL